MNAPNFSKVLADIRAMQAEEQAADTKAAAQRLRTVELMARNAEHEASRATLDAVRAIQQIGRCSTPMRWCCCTR